MALYLVFAGKAAGYRLLAQFEITLARILQYLSDDFLDGPHRQRCIASNAGRVAIHVVFELRAR